MALLNYYQIMGYEGPALRPRCIRLRRARTQLLIESILHLVPRLRMYGAINPLQQMPSLHAHLLHFSGLSIQIITDKTEKISS
jgi:hypothetical protein